MEERLRPERRREAAERERSGGWGPASIEKCRQAVGKSETASKASACQQTADG